MALWMKVAYLSAAILFLVSQLQEVRAQTDDDSVFAHILAYSVSLESLNERYAAQLRAKTQLFKERDEIQRGLADTEKDLNAVNVQGVVNRLRMLENQIALNSTMDELIQLSSPEAWQQAMARGQSARDFRLQRSAVAVSGGLQATNTMTFQGQEVQLNAAARSVVDRRQKLLQSAQDVVSRAQTWIQSERKLIDQYVELADLAGIRSRLELKAALRVFDATEPDNVGARVAKAITLLRLERADDAAELLDGLLQQPSAVRPLALAVRGQLWAAAGETARAKKALNDAVRLAPNKPSLRWLRAQSLAIMNEPEAAVTEWQTMLKSGQYEVAAHRGLALTCCRVSPPSPRYQKLAMEHAQLAQSLAGDDEWSCQIALALATAVSGDLPAAAMLAEAAAEKAIAERRQQCLEMAAQLKAGQTPAWKF